MAFKYEIDDADLLLCNKKLTRFTRWGRAIYFTQWPEWQFMVGSLVIPTPPYLQWFTAMADLTLVANPPFLRSPGKNWPGPSSRLVENWNLAKILTNMCYLWVKCFSTQCSSSSVFPSSLNEHLMSFILIFPSQVQTINIITKYST